MFVLFIRYFIAVILHKLCIILAGIHLNWILRSSSYRVSFQRLILHDLSKFSSSEFYPYAEYFYGKRNNHEEFHQAWLHHVDHNDHHSEHFIENYRRLSRELDKHHLIISEMPDGAILEMVTDNLAATRSYEGFWPERKKKDGWKWLSHSFDRFHLHPNTKIKFTAILCAMGYARVLPNEFDWTSINKSNMSNEDKHRLSQLKILADFNN